MPRSGGDSFNFPLKVFLKLDSNNSKKFALVSKYFIKYIINILASTQSFSCYGKIAGAYATDKCNEYYTCTPDGTPLKKTCPLHTNFFPKTETCVLSYSFSCEGKVLSK